MAQQSCAAVSILKCSEGTRFLKHLAENLYQPGASENAFPPKLRRPGVSDILLKLPAETVRQSGASETRFLKHSADEAFQGAMWAPKGVLQITLASDCL